MSMQKRDCKFSFVCFALVFAFLSARCRHKALYNCVSVLSRRRHRRLSDNCSSPELAGERDRERESSDIRNDLSGSRAERKARKVGGTRGSLWYYLPFRRVPLSSSVAAAVDSARFIICYGVWVSISVNRFKIHFYFLFFLYFFFRFLFFILKLFWFRLSLLTGFTVVLVVVVLHCNWYCCCCCRYINSKLLLLAHIS